MLWSECDADKVIIKGEENLSAEFEQDLVIIHEILERKIEFNKRCKFNDFSYEILS